MKNLTLIFSALLCVLSACGNGSNGVASLKFENGEESEDEQRNSDNRDNLGTCSPKKEGGTAGTISNQLLNGMYVRPF